jgi:hypothetical protein
VVARVEVLGEGVPPSSAYTNVDSGVYYSRDLSSVWEPFSKEPRANYTLYLLPQTLPTQAGSMVRVDIQLAEARLKDPPQPSEDLIIAWDFYNGKKWVTLGRTTREGSTGSSEFDFQDGTEAFTTSGEVRFRMPKGGLGDVEVQGETGPVAARAPRAGRLRHPRPVRARRGEVDLARRAPAAPAVHQGPDVPVQRGGPRGRGVLTYNDFAYFDHSITSKTPLKTFQAFEPSTEDSPALYLGFEKALAERDARIYFRMAEKTSIEQDRRHAEYLREYYADRDRALAAEQRVVWEYWNGRDWVDLAPEDGTRAFTESGFLKIIGPADWKPSKRFGEPLHWVRARLEMGGYHQVPRIAQILLNAVVAQHHTTIRNEILGRSDGTPNQTFRFSQGPLLEGQRVQIIERETPEGEERRSLIEGQGEDAIVPAGKNGFSVAGPRSRVSSSPRAAAATTWSTACGARSNSGMVAAA